METRPRHVDLWEVEAYAAFWAGDTQAAEAILKQGMQLMSAGKLSRRLIHTMLASRQFESAEAIIQNDISDTKDAARMLFTSKAAQGDGTSAKLAGEAWLALYPGENVDWQNLLISAMTGNREAANRIAARFDQNEYGNLALIEMIIECKCGAPWELSATPNFAVKFKESGLKWPPVSPISFPLKDW